MAPTTTRVLIGEARAFNCLTCQRRNSQTRGQWAFYKNDVQLAKRRKHTNATRSDGQPAGSSKRHNAAQSLHELAAQSREHARQQEEYQEVESRNASLASAELYERRVVQRQPRTFDQDAETGKWWIRRRIESPNIEKWNRYEPEWRPRKSPTEYWTKFDYASDLTTALNQNDAPRTTRCLEMVISDQNTEVMKSLSDEAFNLVLQFIHPLKAYGNIMPLQLRLRPSLYKRLKLPGIGHLIDNTKRRLRAVLGLWKYAGKSLTSLHYSSLLEITGYIRAGRPAKKLWAEADKAQLTVKDFNNYLASILYDRPMEFKSDYSERALPYTIRRRTWDVLPPGFRDFRTGDKGALNAITAELDRLSEYGLEPDAGTYAIYIRAASLEGKLAHVNELLQTVWGMDATSIIAGDDGYPIPMARDHLLYPTPDLLGEVVRAYSNNNDMLGATKLLDFMSRFYDIKITSETWFQLLQYAHLLATSRRYEEDPRTAGNVPDSATRMIWQKMLSPPHSAVASIHHADLALRSANREKQTYGSLGIMDFFRTHFMEVSVVNRTTAWNELCNARKVLESEGTLDIFQDHFKHPQLSQLLQRYTECDLECEDALTKFRSWLFYIMHDTQHHDETVRPEHYIVKIPRMLRDWAPFSTRVFYYFIPTGIVELDLGERWYEDGPLLPTTEQKECRNMLKYRTLDPDPFKTSMPVDEPTSSAIHYLGEKTQPPVAQVVTVGHGGKRTRLRNTPENRWPIFNSNYPVSPQVQDGEENTRTPRGDRSWIAVADGSEGKDDSPALLVQDGEKSPRKPLGNRSWIAMASDSEWEGNSLEGRQNYWRHENRRRKKARTPREPVHDPWRYAKPLSFKQRARREQARLYIATT